MLTSEVRPSAANEPMERMTASTSLAELASTEEIEMATTLTFVQGSAGVRR